MKTKLLIIIGIVIAFATAFFVLGPSQGNVTQYFLTDKQFEDMILNKDNTDRYSTYDESNPCDNSHLTNYEEDHQFPLDKMNILKTWDDAKRIPTVENVIVPPYIPNDFELEFLYYNYHKVHAYYGLITEEFDGDVICPIDYQIKGFVIRIWRR